MFHASRLVALLVLTPALASASAYPEVIPLPLGFAPEGIATGRGHTLYAGSLANGGIFEVDLRSGAGTYLVPPQPGRMAVGLAFDRRSNNLFVAGGLGGDAVVYDARTGDPLAVYDFGGGFLNDAIVTRDGVYFTDSFAPNLYFVPLGPAGRLGPPSSAEVIPLGGDFVHLPGEFNANGIVASPNGKALLVVNSATGLLYLVDPDTGLATELDLGGDTLPAGDGLVLAGHTLYVVQNTLNQVSVVELAPDWLSGEVVRVLTSPLFRVPTTLAAHGHRLYAVNARFDVAPPGTPAPTVEFEVVWVPR